MGDKMQYHQILRVILSGSLSLYHRSYYLVTDTYQYYWQLFYSILWDSHLLY